MALANFKDIASLPVRLIVNGALASFEKVTWHSGTCDSTWGIGSQRAQRISSPGRGGIGLLQLKQQRCKRHPRAQPVEARMALCVGMSAQPVEHLSLSRTSAVGLDSGNEAGGKYFGWSLAKSAWVPLSFYPARRRSVQGRVFQICKAVGCWPDKVRDHLLSHDGNDRSESFCVAAARGFRFMGS